MNTTTATRPTPAMFAGRTRPAPTKSVEELAEERIDALYAKLDSLLEALGLRTWELEEAAWEASRNPVLRGYGRVLRGLRPMGEREEFLHACLRQAEGLLTFRAIERGKEANARYARTGKR